jgi:hypothetical protein
MLSGYNHGNNSLFSQIYIDKARLEENLWGFIKDIDQAISFFYFIK